MYKFDVYKIISFSKFNKTPHFMKLLDDKLSFEKTNVQVLYPQSNNL